MCEIQNTEYRHRVVEPMTIAGQELTALLEQDSSSTNTFQPEPNTLLVMLRGMVHLTVWTLSITHSATQIVS